MDIFKEEREESLHLLKFLYARRKVLLFGLFFGILLGVVIYMFLPKKYLSFGIVYPANSYGRSEVISNPQFGHEVESERLMQLLESRSLKDSVIKKFDLISYYKMDTTVPAWRAQLDLKVVKDIQFERTKYVSIVISAEMKRPKLAARVVNYIIEAVNDYRKSIYDQNIQTELDYLKDRRDAQEDRFKAVRDKIYTLKDPSDIDNIIENFLIRSAKEQYYESDFINSVEITELLEAYKTEKHKYMEYDLEYQKALETAKRPVLRNYVVDQATPSFKKESPSKLILAIGGMLGLFVAFIISWLADQFVKIKTELAGGNK